MTSNYAAIESMITGSVTRLIQSKPFVQWFTKAKPTDGDLVIINNSYMLREGFILTNKSDKYLALEVKGKHADLTSLGICKPTIRSSPYSLIPASERGAVPLIDLGTAIADEVKCLGHIIFVLIGELAEIPASVTIEKSVLQELWFEPPYGHNVRVQGLPNRGVAPVVSQLTDPESAWASLLPELANHGVTVTPKTEEDFDKAFKRLQEAARFDLKLPAPTVARYANSLLARIRVAVCTQLNTYRQNLPSNPGSAIADVNLREILRIAYNFSDDAKTLIQLLISISDLKALLLWTTVSEHHDLFISFQNLPWTASYRGKPNIDNYRKMINSARNPAFHNLLDFNRTVQVDLGGIAIQAKQLTLFPPYSGRNQAEPLSYEDKDLVEVLKGLTRAPEIAAPRDFWSRNAEVMQSFVNLLEATENSLWELNCARP